MAVTSRRPNVATSQRHDAPSGNVAMPQRRDVSASYSSQSLKAKGDQNSGGGGGGAGLEIKERTN